MKTYKKLIVGLIVVLGFGLIVVLPFGIKIIREEGWEGVWNRKRATVERAFPETKPIIDEAERQTGNSK